jgi:hypothetical protein
MPCAIPCQIHKNIGMFNYLGQASVVFHLNLHDMQLVTVTQDYLTLCFVTADGIDNISFGQQHMNKMSTQKTRGACYDDTSWHE